MDYRLKKIYYGQERKKATKTVFLGYLTGYFSGFYLHLQISGLLYEELQSHCSGMSRLAYLYL
jgi:hypothetical protein